MVSEVILYSAAFKPFLKNLVCGFQNAHSDQKLIVIDGVSTELDQRYKQSLIGEGVIPDLFWSSAMDLQLQLIEEGHARPFACKWTESLPSWARFEQLGYSTTLEPIVNLINKDIWPINSLGGNYDEILESLSQYKASDVIRVAMFDIRKNGLSSLLMAHAMRTEVNFINFISTIAESEHVKVDLYGSNPPMMRALESQTTHLCINVLGSYAVRALSEISTAARATGKSESIGVSRVAFIPLKAKNPKGAELLLEYILSPEGQCKLDMDGLFPLKYSKRDIELFPSIRALGLKEDIEPLNRENFQAKILEIWTAKFETDKN